MKKTLRILIVFILCSKAYLAMAQIEGDAIFLQGCFIEVAISNCGVYGSATTPPVGPEGEYHGVNTNGLGFIADHEKDGWDVSTGTGEPVFCGDYFTPGSPEEGWAIQYGSSVWENHYVGCYGYGESSTGTYDIPGDIVSYADVAGVQEGIWAGELDDDIHITITQRTVFPNGALFFLTGVEICNEGTEDLVDLYYMRNVDPDQDVDHCGEYTTTNTIEYYPPDDADTALVSGIGIACGCYLGMGAIDSRARGSFGAFGISPNTPEEAWSGTGAYSTSGSITEDGAIQITFKIDVPAGECQTIYYAHILDPSDLKQALEATLSGGVGITANDVSISASGEYGICEPGDTVILEVNGDPGVIWTITPDTYLDTDTGSYYVAVPLETTTYTITGIGGECGDVTTEITLVVDNEEFADAGPDEDICFGLSTTLAGAGGGEYLWEPAEGLDDPESATPVAAPSETTIYTLTTIDEYGCPAYDTMKLTVNPLPDVNAGADGRFCVDGSYQLEATGAVTYSWSPSDGLDNPNIANPVSTVDNTTTYTVTGTDANGCINTDEVILTVDLLPEVIAVANPYSIDAFLGETSQLNVTTGGEIFNWEPPTGLSSTTIQNPVANPTDTTIYVVTVTDDKGCVNTDTVIVNAKGEITIDFPNAFSPNGDGVNDTYYPLIQGSGVLVDYLIFNRWGELVYAGSPGDGGWDGGYNGKESPIGSYAVVINAVTSLGQAKFEKGYFTLIR